MCVFKYMSVPHVHAGAQKGQKRASDPLGSRIPDDCKQPCRC